MLSDRSFSARALASSTSVRISLVDEHCRGLAVVLDPAHLSAEEDLPVLVAERHGAEHLAHAPLADHAAGDVRRVADVAARRRS